MIEYVCCDCGGRVYSNTLPPPGERASCATCDWIRRHVPPWEQLAARERLGVPLMPEGCQVSGAMPHRG